MNVAVVVPTKNSARTIGRCLTSISEQSLPPSQVVVVDNRSSDDTHRIAGEHGATVIVAGPERSAQRNVGWRAVSADVVAFIDSDMVLEAEVLEQAVRAFETDSGLGALVIPELSFGQGFFARCRALEKRLYLGDPSVEAARVFRRAALEQIGGYDESLVAGEDWDLADRAAASGWDTGRTVAVVRHDEGHVRLRTVFTKKRYYGTTMSSYNSTSRRRSPLRLSLLDLRAARREPLAYAGLLLLKLVDLTGLVVGSATARLRRVP